MRECQTRIVVLAILAIFHILNFKATVVDQFDIEDMCDSRKYSFQQYTNYCTFPLPMNEAVNMKNFAILMIPHFFI